MAGLCETVLLIALMLLFGSYNTVDSKMCFQTTCPTLPEGSGKHILFNKPWLFNLLMFVGEASMLIPLGVKTLFKKRQRINKIAVGKTVTQPLLPEQVAPWTAFAIPAACDILGSGISSVSMMYIDAAVWQMMRGSIVVFTAILSVVWLKRMLHFYHWVGVGFTVFGLILIGFAAVAGEPKNPTASSNMSLGIGLVIVSQVFSAIQMIAEERALTGYTVSSLKVVGAEGIWGILYMCVILAVMSQMKGEDHGSYESVPDGLYMLFHTPMLQFLAVSFMLSLATYNFVGMQLCRKLSAVTRCLVDCMRTGTVWGFELFLHYCISDQYGQAWNEYSYIQLLGFAFMMTGTFIYNGVLKLPSWDYRTWDRRYAPKKVLHTMFSPMQNRAAQFGRGAQGQFGPTSPHSPDSPDLEPLHPSFQASAPPSPGALVEASWLDGSPSGSPGGSPIGAEFSLAGIRSMVSNKFPAR